MCVVLSTTRNLAMFMLWQLGVISILNLHTIPSLPHADLSQLVDSCFASYRNRSTRL